MIRLERTFDYALVRTLFTHPRLYPRIFDDFAPPPEHFWPMESPALYHLLAYEGDELLGMFVTHAINPLLWEVHHALLPNAWGRRAREAGKAYLAWLWEHTRAELVFGCTPASNALALRFAKSFGLRETGRLPGCFLQRGQRHDLVILGKSRPTDRPRGFPGAHNAADRFQDDAN